MIPAVSYADATILIVDDEPENVRLLKRLLGRGGYLNVSSTTDSAKVEEICRLTSPDLVLLDLHMPGIDGVGVMRRIMGQGDDKPYVVMLTGDTSSEARLSAFTHGARDFIGKPFEIAEVLLRINNLLELRWTARRLRKQNMMLEASVRVRTMELDDARLEVIERLALAAEMRDGATGEHIRRVGDISGDISAALGLPTEQCELIRRAAPLHDVGKIAIPDRILLKMGALTAAERAVMQTHTTVGAHILTDSQSPLIQLARQIALYHHERWDGGGYPEGLRGVDIPLPARVVGVADYFDALTSDRAYRPAYSRQVATKMLEEGSGSHFDPAVVDAFRVVCARATSLERIA